MARKSWTERKEVWERHYREYYPAEARYARVIAEKHPHLSQSLYDVVHRGGNREKIERAVEIETKYDSIRDLRHSDDSDEWLKLMGEIYWDDPDRYTED